MLKGNFFLKIQLIVCKILTKKLHWIFSFLEFTNWDIFHGYLEIQHNII